MYLKHFRLRTAPFSLTPDTGFFHDAGTHREAMNVLLVALANGEGFIKITGEVGVGKTLLCRKLMNSLDERYAVAYIHNPLLSPHALQTAIADELGIKFASNVGQYRLMKLVIDRLVELRKQGKRAVLLVDEAQTMPDNSLEALRLITNLETEREKLLQIVLFGQPELDRRLLLDHLRQLRQRVVFSCTIKPLDRRSLSAYVHHRLRRAGYVGIPLFTAAAIAQLHTASRGIPRLVNVLCHKSLMAAYGKNDPIVTHRHVLSAVRDTEDATRSTFPLWQWKIAHRLGASMLAGICLHGIPGGWL